MSNADTPATSQKQKPRLSTKVAERIDTARDILFRAQTIASVAAAASTSETPAHNHATESTLRYVAEILSEVVDILDPTNLVSVR